MLSRTPIVVILGSTATGKTKLSIELARRFNGEIISADSMQIYKGLDISTAKATAEERAQAPHHLLDVCDVKTQTYSIHDFRDAALPIVDNLLASNRMPIIVGGTNYYIESLLWKTLVTPSRSDRESDEEDGLHDARVSIDEIVRRLCPNEVGRNDPEFLYELLTKVDPKQAQRIHPNDQRKVLRALQVYATTGRRISDIWQQQQNEEGGNYLGGPLRYDNVVMFWLRSDQSKLNQRIDKRIDSMIAQGLLKEIRHCYDLMRADLIAAGRDPNQLDCTLGMTQAIGFKEFVPYLQKYTSTELDEQLTEFVMKYGSNPSQRVQRPEGLNELSDGLEELRLRTKQYAKKQIKWIQNRLIRNKGRPVPSIYELNATNAETQWNEDVYLNAEDVVEAFIDGRVPNQKPMEFEKHSTDGLATDVTFFCQTCERLFVGEHVYNAHLKSNLHRKVLQSKNKKKRRDENRNGIIQTFKEFRLIRTFLWCFDSLSRRLSRIFRR